MTANHPIQQPTTTAIAPKNSFTTITNRIYPETSTTATAKSTIGGSQLRVLQDCPRRFVIEKHWRIRRWLPRALFNHCMRKAVVAISNGAEPGKTGEQMATLFLERAANPGLLIWGHSPYEMAQDFAAALRVTCELLGRTVLMPLKPGPVMALESHSWAVESFADESGCLHWWTAVERADASEISRIGHSWRYADSVFAGTPLTLHLVEVGHVRNGHLHGDLTRIYQHPEVVKYKFRHIDGRPLSGWKPKWLQDMDRMTPKQWCDLLATDKLSPITHVPLKQAEGWRAEEFGQDVLAEVARTESLPEDWRDIPMTREACDRWGGCPHQNLCLGPYGSTPESVGGYAKST